MKKKIIIFVFLFSLLFSACKISNKEFEYEVWTNSVSYSAYFSLTNTFLASGLIYQTELTEDEFDYYALVVDDDFNYWTESQIENFFTSRGLTKYRASQQAEWVTSCSHCLLAYRVGDRVYMLLK